MFLSGRKYLLFYGLWDLNLFIGQTLHPAYINLIWGWDTENVLFLFIFMRKWK